MTKQLYVEKSILVSVDAETAYRIFTRNFDSIKPREHNLLESPIEETIFEARPGGRILDRATDGTECVWGEVLSVNPPQSLRFAWFIGPDWRVQPREFASEVEIRFLTVDDNSTNIVLIHRNIDRHGPGWDDVLNGVDSTKGWPLYLNRFAELILDRSSR